MATRIDIELTSRRDDTTFTWRAAGAREPRGIADVSLFPTDAEVGAEFKVEAEVELDGITITQVIPAKAPKARPIETLELLGGDDEPLVTQQLARKPRRDRERRGKDKRRRGGKDGDGRDDGRPRGGPRHPVKPKLPPKPKPPRLKAGRAHRKALLDALPDEQRPVAEELFRGGLKSVRTALAKQNDQLKTEGKPQIDEAPLLALAEKLLIKVREAEWLDRADAALAQAGEVDLRDLRAVVTAADSVAKDDESRAMAASLRTALADRLDRDHQSWIDEINELLDEERVVRALHLSSRPPKAGAPLPPPVALRLVEATNTALTSDVAAERWGYTIEALAHSPIRRQVVPASLPTQLTDELKALIARHGNRLPELAEIFGIEADPTAGRPASRRRRKPKKPAAGPEAGAQPANPTSDAAPATPEATSSEPEVAETETASAEPEVTDAEVGGDS